MAPFRLLLRNHRILSNAVIYSSLYAGSELSQQTMLRRLDKSENGATKVYDFAAVLRYALYGGTVLAPMYFLWYKWLDSRFTGVAMKTIAKKLVIDQLILAPPTLAMFFIGMNILEGKYDVVSELKKKWPRSYAMSCVFWIPVQAFNFYYLPSQWRVIYVGSCNFIWVNFLCYIKRKEF